jgi:hypothetical protein
MSDAGNREITLPASIWTHKYQGGHSLCVPVRVDWPEVQLTEEQSFANAIARAFGGDPPYPDHAFINVIVPIPAEWLQGDRS